MCRETYYWKMKPGLNPGLDLHPWYSVNQIFTSRDSVKIPFIFLDKHFFSSSSVMTFFLHWNKETCNKRKGHNLHKNNYLYSIIFLHLIKDLVFVFWVRGWGSSKWKKTKQRNPKPVSFSKGLFFQMTFLGNGIKDQTCTKAKRCVLNGDKLYSNKHD